MRRSRYLAVLSLISLTACTGGGSSPKAGPAPTGVITVTTATTVTKTPTTTTTTPMTAPPTEPPPPAKVCPVGTVYSTPPPEWTGSANPPADARWVVGRNGSAVGILFNDPPRAGRDNKILWIVKVPRYGFPLRIRATPLGGRTSLEFTPVPPDAGPGEIYPSTASVPAPGCWTLTLSWGAAQDTVVVPFS